jgi:hypothetical protein
MVRPTKPIALKKTINKPAGSPASKSKTTTSKAPAAKAKALAKKQVKAPAPAAAPKKNRAARAPVIAKADLRASIEKLESTVVTLRTKNRESTKALKIATARIVELEAQLAAATKTLEKAEVKVAPAKAPAGKGAAKKPAAKKRTATPVAVEPAEASPADDDASAELPGASDGEAG